MILNISTLLIFFITLTATLYSYTFCFRNFNPPYLKIFPIYLTISLFAVLPYWIIVIRPITAIIQTAFTFFEMLIFFKIFQIILFKNRHSLIMLFIPIIVIGICIVDIMHKNSFHNYALYAIFDLVSITTLCLMYFKKVFTSEPTINLIEEPSFWIASGCLIYFLGTIPLLIFDFLLSRKKIPQLSQTTYENLYSINNILFSVMAILLIKSFICKKKVSTSA